MRSKIATKAYNKTPQSTKDKIRSYGEILLERYGNFKPTHILELNHYSIELELRDDNKVLYRYITFGDVYTIDEASLKNDINNDSYFVDSNNLIQYINKFKEI